MTQADKNFIDTCKEIMKNGYSSEGTSVRTRWEDGSEANYISIVGVCNKYDVGKEFPMITLRNNSATVKRAIDEVLWIWQKKSNNINELNSHIWDQWADENGTIGKAYGYQMGKKYEFRALRIWYTMVSKRWKVASYIKTTLSRYVSSKWMECYAICGFAIYVCTGIRFRSWNINT